MNILFLGLMFEESDEIRIIENSKSGVGTASNILQWNMIKGLASNTNLNISILSSLPVGNFPNNNRKIYYTGKEYTLDNIEFYKEIKTVNLPIIKHIIRKKDFLDNITGWLSQNKKTDQNIIIIYDLYRPFLTLIKKLKKEYTNLTILVTVPDLVGELRNDTGGNIFEKKLRDILNPDAIMLMNDADGYFLVSHQISEFIQDKNKPRLVFNGIVNEFKDKPVKLETSSKIIFMYSGLLSKQYQIKELVEIFISNPNMNSELWICGYGEVEDYLKTINNSNIKFYGLLSKNEASKLEYSSDILINPRPNQEEYTKFSFPSKNLEYLLLGKPVICYKLDSFPSSLDKVFEFIDVNNPDSLSELIHQYSNMSKSEIAEIGMNNRDFVINNFGITTQGKKINKFLEEMVDENEI